MEFEVRKFVGLPRGKKRSRVRSSVAGRHLKAEERSALLKSNCRR